MFRPTNKEVMATRADYIMKRRSFQIQIQIQIQIRFCILKNGCLSVVIAAIYCQLSSVLYRPVLLFLRTFHVNSARNIYFTISYIFYIFYI
jgi:hypothetical protein